MTASNDPEYRQFLELRVQALLDRIGVLERALENIAHCGQASTLTLTRLMGARAQAALDGEGYRDRDHYDRMRDEQAEGLGSS